MHIEGVFKLPELLNHFMSLYMHRWYIHGNISNNWLPFDKYNGMKSLWTTYTRLWDDMFGSPWSILHHSLPCIDIFHCHWSLVPWIEVSLLEIPETMNHSTIYIPIIKYCIRKKHPIPHLQDIVKICSLLVTLALEIVHIEPNGGA